MPDDLITAARTELATASTDLALANLPEVDRVKYRLRIATDLIRLAAVERGGPVLARVHARAETFRQQGKPGVVLADFAPLWDRSLLVSLVDAYTLRVFSKTYATSRTVRAALEQLVDLGVLVPGPVPMPVGVEFGPASSTDVWSCRSGYLFTSRPGAAVVTAARADGIHL